MKKYKLTNIKTHFNNRTLYRIQALKSFNDVKEGDLGGFVESEENLSQDDFCWVYNDAKVFDDARVRYDAQIHNNAIVFDQAVISDRAIISDGACVFNTAIVNEYAQIKGRALVFGNANVYGHAVVDTYAIISDSALVYDHTHVTDRAHVNGPARISGNAVISNHDDYIIFQNTWSNQRPSLFFTYTKSNNKWRVGDFYGTGAELIEHAKQLNSKSSKYYQLYVELVEKLTSIHYISVEKQGDKSLSQLLPDKELQYLLEEWTKLEFDHLTSQGWRLFEQRIKHHQKELYMVLHTDEEKQVFARAIASQYALERVREPLHKICDIMDIDLLNTLLNEYQIVD